MNVLVGRIQRESPLPAGQYWIDVIGPKAQSDFAAWRFENQNTLLILTTESFPGEGGFPSREWVKFEVLQPTPWNLGTTIGFPDIIEEGQQIDSSDDTVQKPDISELPCDSVCQLQRTGMIAIGILALGIGFMLVKR